MGWSELEGIANRTDYDLRRHAEFSGEDLSYFDPATEERYVPYVIEPSAGADRATLAFMVDAYDEEEVAGRSARCCACTRAWRRSRSPCCRSSHARGCRRRRAPYTRSCASVIPAEFDEGGSIGRRYRRQDEIGTPWAVTVDGDTMKDDTVTVRDRDSLEQVRVPASTLVEEFSRRMVEDWRSPKLG